MKTAIILFSGGMDSTTCLAYALDQGYDCHALSFVYGQRHSAELAAAKKIATHYQVSHQIFELPIGQFGGSSLTDAEMQVKDYDPADSAKIPNSYVPARNTIFLSVALALAEVKQASDIFIGVSFIDYSNYPDCRPEYIAAFQTMANLATKQGIDGHATTIHTPLIQLSKAATIQLGKQLGVDYRMTVSCYRANAAGEACGNCTSCVLRKKGFREAHLTDETRYVIAD